MMSRSLLAIMHGTQEQELWVFPCFIVYISSIADLGNKDMTYISHDAVDREKYKIDDLHVTNIAAAPWFLLPPTTF